MAPPYQITDHGDHLEGDCHCEIIEIGSEFVWAEPVPGDPRDDFIILRSGWMLAEQVQGAFTARPRRPPGGQPPRGLT